MQTQVDSARNDMYLSFARGEKAVWTVLESPAKYFIPMKIHKWGNRSAYLQGTCCNCSGKPLAIEEIATLIDRYRTRALDHLDGSFVLAVDDERDGVWCATDHSATLPLYYKLSDDGLIITTRP